MSSFIIKSELKAPKTGYDCLSSFLIDRLKTWHEDIIVIDCDSDHRLTGEQIYESSLNFAYHLITEFLLKPGDIVCFITPNSYIHAIALLGVIAAGGVICSLSPLSTYREVNDVITNVRPHYLVCNSDTYGIVATLTAEMPYIKKFLVIDEQSRKQLNLNCDTIENILQYERSFLPLPISGSLNETAALIMSSGSTGKPKAVIHTNRSLIALANVLQHNELDELNRGDIVMFNSFSQLCGLRCLFQAIAGGATIALTANNDWRELFLRQVEKYSITSAYLVPSTLYFMVKSDSIVGKYDLSSLQDVMVGGASLSENIHDLTNKKFNFKHFRNTYSMPEIGWTTNVFISESKSIKNCKTIGRPVAGVEIKVIDNEGKSLPFKSIGEICVRGDQLTKGYLNNDAENRNAFTTDGFFKTGDFGYYDSEGLFYITGRSKEIIKLNGVVVSPAELEAILLSHSAVEDAAVIDIEDEEYFELPKAFVVIKKDMEADEESLTEFFNIRVEPFKRLNEIKILNEFPRTANGKIKKYQLKKMFIDKQFI